MLECRLEILLITSKRSPGYCMSLGDTQGSLRRCFSFSFCCVKMIFFCIFSLITHPSALAVILVLQGNFL